MYKVIQNLVITKCENINKYKLRGLNTLARHSYINIIGDISFIKST